MSGMVLHDMKLMGTTDGSGDLTVNGEVSIYGLLYAVEWVDGAFSDGVDAVLSVTRTASGVDQTLNTLANANDDGWYHPSRQGHDLAGALVTGVYELPVINGRLKLVVSSGGATVAGGCIVHYWARGS
jgi:hypothetical protein